MNLSAKGCLFSSLMVLAACSSGLEQDLPELEPLAGATTLQISLSSNADDAEEGRGGLTKSGKALDFSQNGQTVGLRFANVKIPQGAKIKSATLHVTAIAADSAPVKLQVRAEDSDNAISFGRSIKDRAKTSAAGPWNPRAWQEGRAARTGDLSQVVQEVVSRRGWESGNALALYVTGDRNVKRSAYARDKSSRYAPLLKITFEPNFRPDNSPEPEPEKPEPSPSGVPSSSCLNRGNAEQIELNGSYRSTVLIRGKSSGIRIDARDAKFLPGAPIIANFNGGSFCLSGGFLDTGLSDDTDWGTFHSAHSLLFYNTPNAVIENMVIYRAGDGITFKDNNPNWVFRDSYVRHAGDDGVENDRFNDGTVDDVLIDWAYTGVSCRKEQQVPDVDYDFTIRNSLIALKPQVGTYGGYKGNQNALPSHNQLFKVTQGVTKGCRLVLKDNVFLISGYAGYIDPSDDPKVNYDILDRAACQGNKNTIVYTGGNAYYLKELQAAAPECFDVTTDINVWKAARSRWFDRHPGFSEYRNNEPMGARN